MPWRFCGFKRPEIYADQSRRGIYHLSLVSTIGGYEGVGVISKITSCSFFGFKDRIFLAGKDGLSSIASLPPPSYYNKGASEIDKHRAKDS